MLFRSGLRFGERAVRLNPGASLVHFGCGMACLFLNRVDEALAHYDADIKASPGAPINFFNFTFQGNAYIRTGRWSEALTALEHALALYTENPLALIFKAVLYKRAGRAAEARDLLLRTRHAERAGTYEVWEMNFKRAFVRSPNLEELLEHLRSLWADTETSA